MSYRARAAGLRVVLVPQATAVHRESSTAGAGLPSRMLALEAGRIRLVCKHWPAQQLQREFLPAELDYVRRTTSPNRNVLRWVYLKALHEIDDLACWRERLGVGDRAQSTAMLAAMLTQLRRACVPEISVSPSPDRVAQMVETWFTPESAASYPLHLSLYQMNGRTETSPTDRLA